MDSSLQVCASLGQDTEGFSIELGLSRHRDFTICNEICFEVSVQYSKINLLTPNVDYSGRIAPLTSKVAFYIFIQQI